MKKAVWVGLLIISTIFLAYQTSSAVCPPDVATASSELGIGGARICGVDYMCGIDDGICPELFNDTNGRVGNCSNCPDPDCTGFVNGTVFDNSTGTPRPLIGANVSLFFSYKKTYSISDANGNYRLETPSGFQTIGASKTGYDTVIHKVFVPNNVTQGNATQDFFLPIGICHPDCTNEFGRCNPACEGFVFANTSDNCTYSSEEVKQACANKLGGSEVFMEYYNETHAYYADCCEGLKVLKYRPKPVFECKDGSGFVKTKKIALLKGKLVNLVVAVCKPKKQ